MTHLPYIAASYALVLLVLGGLGLTAFLRHRAAHRRITALER
jgi:heme exporter protein CcmD